MERVGFGMRVVVLAAALVVSTAAPALAHGDEHDVRRIAHGTVAGADVTVWTADAPTPEGLPVTVGVDGAPGAEVRILTPLSGGQRTVIVASDVGGGHWTAIVPLAAYGATALEVEVIGDSGAGSLLVEYLAPSASWWMKAIVVVALLQGAACARWLWGRRHGVFERARLSGTQTMVGSTAA